MKWRNLREPVRPFHFGEFTEPIISFAERVSKSLRWHRRVSPQATALRRIMMLAHAVILLLLIPSAALPSMSALGPDSAFNACSAASVDEAGSKKAAADAEAYYRRVITQNPDDLHARILLARTLSQCVMSHASVWSKEGIVKESNSLLIDVLKRDSTSWEARYTLALNYYHAPAFFGWTDNAIGEFERLLAQQGDQAYFPEQAKPYLYLGILYSKKGRQAEAKAVWQRGSRLFPDDVRLRQRATAQP